MIDSHLFARACHAAGLFGFIRPATTPDKSVIELFRPGEDLTMVQEIGADDVLSWGSVELAIAAAIWRANQGFGPQFASV